MTEDSVISSNYSNYSIFCSGQTDVVKEKIPKKNSFFKKTQNFFKIRGNALWAIKSNCYLNQRCKPTTIISENVTKFDGAEREFGEQVGACNKEGIEEHLIQRGIRRKLSSPASYLFGGMWERLDRNAR